MCQKKEKKNSVKQKWERDLQLVTGYGCFSAPACRDDCDSSKQQQQLVSAKKVAVGNGVILKLEPKLQKYFRIDQKEFKQRCFC